MTAISKVSNKQFKPVQERMIELGLSKETVMKEVSFALQLINSNNHLLQCTPESLQSAVINIANIGLTLNPAARQAYLIPRWNGRTQKKEAVLEPSYMGLIFLSVSTRGINQMIANIVRENDFIQLDLADNIKPVTHKPELVKSKAGAIIGAYALATLPDGTRQVEWMDIDALHDIRGRSDGYKSGKPCPWTTDQEEMMKKTVIKRALKRLPIGRSEQLEKAIELDNEDYFADFTQLNRIDTLMQQIILPDEVEKNFRLELSGGVGKKRAKEIINFLNSFIVEDVRYTAGKGKIKTLDQNIKNAVEDERR